MSAVLVCDSCGLAFPVRSPRVQCSCGGLLSVRQAPSRSGSGPAVACSTGVGAAGTPRVATAACGASASCSSPTGIPLVSHPEGNTCLYRRDAVAAFAGIADLALKHEGENPTGSFKDRGMTVAVTHAAAWGATAVACASTGNTSASMAAYAAQAGHPRPRLRAGRQGRRGEAGAGPRLRRAHAHGARATSTPACASCARPPRRSGIALLNSINPWRIEGQKTIVLEMLQQRGWDPPDWIVVPAGNLGNTAAFGKALREARDLGLIRRVPRIASIQAAGANPFHRSFRTGFRRRFTVKAETIATAIRIGDPASYDRGVRAIRETRGVVASVTDREILEAKAVVDAAGIGCEPASAASVAGVRRLVRRGHHPAEGRRSWRS